MKSKRSTRPRTPAATTAAAFTPEEEEFFRAGDAASELETATAFEDDEVEVDARRPGLLTRLRSRWQTG